MPALVGVVHAQPNDGRGHGRAVEHVVAGRLHAVLDPAHEVVELGDRLLRGELAVAGRPDRPLHEQVAGALLLGLGGVDLLHGEGDEVVAEGVDRQHRHVEGGGDVGDVRRGAAAAGLVRRRDALDALVERVAVGERVHLGVVVGGVRRDVAGRDADGAARLVAEDAEQEALALPEVEGGVVAGTRSAGQLGGQLAQGDALRVGQWRAQRGARGRQAQRRLDPAARRS